MLPIRVVSSETRDLNGDRRKVEEPPKFSIED